MPKEGKRWEETERTLEGEDTTLALSLISDVRVLLAHADHHTLVAGTSNDGGEDLSGKRKCRVSYRLSWSSQPQSPAVQGSREIALFAQGRQRGGTSSNAEPTACPPARQLPHALGWTGRMGISTRKYSRHEEHHLQRIQPCTFLVGKEIQVSWRLLARLPPSS